MSTPPPRSRAPSRRLERPIGLEAANAEIAAFGVNTGETFVLGDSPLVLVTAVQSSFLPGLSSSRSVRLRPGVRVFTQLDSALLVRDLYAKVRRHGVGG